MSKMSGLLPILKDEMLEISIGDDYEELQTSDTTKKVNGVIYGILRDIVDDFVILDCCFINKRNEIQFGNIIYINTLHIKVFTKVKSNGCLNDVMLSTSHTRKIKQLLDLDD